MKLQLLLHAWLMRCGGTGARGAALPLVFLHVAHLEGLDEAAVFRLVTPADRVGGGSRRGLAVVAEEVCVICEYRNCEYILSIDRANGDCQEDGRWLRWLSRAALLTFPSNSTVVFIANPLGNWLLRIRAHADGGGHRSVLVMLAPHAVDVPRLAALAT